ncbi:MAG TPA: ribbon-helix-helix protein, CopG family [Nitrosarchaeum sp.]
MTSNGFKSITVREKTYTKIEELARRENRSVSNLIDTLIMTNLIKEENIIQ